MAAEMGTVVEAEAEAEARTSVWWDIENCQVPKNSDALGIAQNISSALLKMNYSGPISISAYGDINRIPSSVQQALSSTGVALHHVPSGAKDASDKTILVDMLFWAVDNPAPANFMLITGDRDFSSALHKLSMRRYNILLAHPQAVSAPLVAAAKTVWLWTSLAAGGRPLTRGDSSRVVDECCFPDPEISRHPVSEQVDNRRIVDGGNKGDFIPEASNQPVEQETKRKNFQSSGATSSFENFTTHLSDKRHAAQATFVASCGSQVSVLTKTHEENKAYPASCCNVGQTRCNSEVKHVNRKLEQKQQKNIKLMSVKPENTFTGLVECPKDDVGKGKKKVIEGRAEAEGIRVCRLCSVVCQSKTVYKSHMRGRKHAAMVKKQTEELFDVKRIQEESVREKDQPREAIKPKNASAGPAKCSKGEMEKKNKKLVEGGAKANAIKVCDLCSVVCDNQNVFDSHLRGRKHAAKVEEQREAPSDAKKIQEERILEKDQPREVIQGVQFQSQEEQKNTRCLEKQSRELMVGADRRLPNAECIFFDLNLKYPVHKEARECINASIEKFELPRDVETMEKLGEGIVRTKLVAEGVRVCRLCSVVCQSQAVFESHMRGRKHAAMVKKQTEAPSDAKERILEKDQPRDVIQEVQFQSQEEQKNTRCLEKQNKEKIKCLEKQSRELMEGADRRLPNAECIFTDLNLKYPVHKEARECNNPSSMKFELPRDVETIEKLKDQAGQSRNSVCRIS